MRERKPPHGRFQQPAAEAGQNAPGVAVVVTNYNTWDLTRRCVEGVERVEPAVIDIVVIDDASTDDCPAALTSRVRLMRNEQNQGLVRSLNRGIRATHAEAVVLFDSDAEPLTPFAEKLLELFETDPRLGIVGFDTVDAAGNPTGSWEREPGALSLLLPPRLHGWLLGLWPPKADGAISVFTCAMAIRRSAFEEIGGFDERFDWLDLDHDICWQARQAGWRVARLPSVRALHAGSGAPQTKPARVERAFRNRWLLLRKMKKLKGIALVRAFLWLRIKVEYAVAWAAARALGASGARFHGVCESRRRILRFLRDEAR